MKNNFGLKAVEEKAYVTQSEYVIGAASSFVESFLFFSHERTQEGVLLEVYSTMQSDKLCGQLIPFNMSRSSKVLTVLY